MGTPQPHFLVITQSILMILTCTHFKLFTFTQIKNHLYTDKKSVYSAKRGIKNTLDFIHSANIFSTIPEN